MARLAFMTISEMHGPWGDPVVRGLQERFPVAFAAAEASEGFLGRSRWIEGDLSAHWGPSGKPTRFVDADAQNRVAATLSLWRDLESVFAYTYAGVHGEALGHRREWFDSGHGPSYVAFWVDDDQRPSWREASLRYEALERDGATPYAFDFKRSFDPSGAAVKVDRDAVRAILERRSGGGA